MTQEIPTRLVINCETGEREIIPLTAEEIAEREQMRIQAEADRAAREAEEVAKVAARASGLAKLQALGLTEAEATALLN
jgi:hypothetical protein